MHGVDFAKKPQAIANLYSMHDFLALQHSVFFFYLFLGYLLTF